MTSPPPPLSPAFVPLASADEPIVTTPKAAKPSADHGKDDDEAAEALIAIGFPSTPLNRIKTPNAGYTPCITPIPNPPLATNDDNRDELDTMLCHEDFEELLSLAAKVKSLYIYGDISKPQQTSGKDGPLDASEVLKAVTRLQERLLSDPSRCNSELSVGAEKIPRGVYPMTDSLFDDAFAILRQELDRCHQIIALQPNESQPITKKKKRAAVATRINKSNKEAIAIKYSKWQTDVLMKWMIENIDNPFPDQDAVHDLMQQANLTYSQCINWTTNVRKRNKKATIEEKKKPHHFIDFLFLAQKRDEEREAQFSTPQLQFGSVPNSPSRGTTATGSAPGAGQSTCTPTSSSQKKRKLDCSLPPLKPSTPAPSLAQYPGTPTHPTAAYSPFTPTHDYGFIPFPTSPAYYYSPSYHAYYPAPGAAVGVDSNRGSPYTYLPVFDQQSGRHQGQHSHPGDLPGMYGVTPPPPRYYQRQPPSRPPTPCASNNESNLQPIQEHEHEKSVPSPVLVKSSPSPSPSPSNCASGHVKKEQDSEEDTKPAASTASDEPKPDAPASYDGVQIKQEFAGCKQGSGNSPLAPLEDGTAMDPIDIDGWTPDPNVLHDFATYWAIYLANDGGPPVDREGHAVYVLRADASESSQDVPALTEETSSKDEEGGASEMEQVTSDVTIGI